MRQKQRSTIHTRCSSNDRDGGSRTEAGFTLIEMLIASFILLIGVLSVGAMVGSSITQNLISKTDSVAMSLAEREMERLKSLDFGSPSLVSGSTSQTLVNADYGTTGVNYTITWTVTTEGASAPAPGVKRIAVTAKRTYGNYKRNYPDVQLTFVKAR